MVAPIRESRLVVPRPLYQHALERLLEVRGERTVLLRVGRAVLSQGGELWLARGLAADHAALAVPAAGEKFFAITRHDGSGPMPWVESQLDGYPDAVVGEIFCGEGPHWQGRTWGFVRRDDGTRYAALGRLLLPGAKMQEIPLLARAEPWPPPLDAAERQRLSRTIGAFGADGEHTVAGMRAGRYVLAGGSRSGSSAFELLARLGAETTLFDQKPLELSHLGEIGLLFSPEDLGRAKALCAVDGLVRAQGTCGRMRACAEGIDSPAGVAAAKEATVLIACVDNEAAHLAMGMLSVLYLKPYLTIATGVSVNAESRWDAGADIKLLLPHDRCVRCCGELADYPRALRELTTDRRLLAAQRAATRWHDERAGSLRSLNQIAVGIGFRLLEDLFAGRVRESKWVRVEYDNHGLINIDYPSMGHRDADCPLCRKAGEGDAAL